ncbi:MAG TPA: hypothetical protein VE996_01635 [Terriglobales bacterium]|nr:hypothetical protein [Terriglobales bacterium]
MAGRSRPSFQKRQKEKARQERQKEKMERRLQRSHEKASRVNHDDDIDYSFSIYAGLEEAEVEEEEQQQPS